MAKLRFSTRTASVASAVAAVTLIGAGVAYAFDSGDKPEATGPDSITWTGQGADGGSLNNVECGEEDPLGVDQPYLLWVLTPDGGSITNDASTPVLHLGGTGSGDYTTSNPGSSPAKFVTPYFTPDSGLTATADMVITATGNGAWNLVISHGCPPVDDPQAALHVRKFYDADADGIHDAGEPEIDGWRVTYDSTVGYAPVDVDPIDPGDYTVAEGTPIESNWFHTTPSSVSITLADGDDKTVEFGNVCVGAGGGLTLGFWSNRNGQALIDPAELTALVDLNLVNANGSPFDPASKAVLKNWLLSGTAVNMAYMLSVQLAAMELNVLNGKVNGNALVYGGPALGFVTINALMTSANTELGLHPTANSGNAWRSYQETLKNALDRANNNQSFVQASPCPFTFAS